MCNIKKAKKDQIAANGLNQGIESKDLREIMSAIKISKVCLPSDSLSQDAKVNYAKSFANQLHTTAISDFVMPQSHFSRQLVS